MSYAVEPALVSRWLVFALTLLCLTSMFEHLIDKLCHTSFALESGTLNALKTLRIGFLPKHLLFVWQHLLFFCYVLWIIDDYRQKYRNSYNSTYYIIALDLNAWLRREVDRLFIEFGQHSNSIGCSSAHPTQLHSLLQLIFCHTTSSIRSSPISTIDVFGWFLFSWQTTWKESARGLAQHGQKSSIVYEQNVVADYQFQFPTGHRRDYRWGPQNQYDPYNISNWAHQQYTFFNLQSPYAPNKYSPHFPFLPYSRHVCAFCSQLH